MSSTASFPVVNRMHTVIAAWNPVSDRRAIFLTCYAMMTHNMFVAIDDNEFEDGVWVSRLLHCFADYYFEALTGFEAETPTLPDVWRVAFDSASRSSLHVLQYLLLGINAHICYDLVFALRDMLRDEWDTLDAAQRERRYRDHCHVNTIIYRTINKVQDEVVEQYSPMMAKVDDWMGNLDEWLLHRLISDWRDDAWHQTVQLMGCASDDEQQRICGDVAARSLKRAHAIVGQKGLLGVVHLL